MNQIIVPIQKLSGKFTVPGDKSISHRAVMFGAIAQGVSEIYGFLNGADCLSTIRCFRQMGIEIEETHDFVRVNGKGLHGLRRPQGILDVGNSGTTMRLLSGLLAGQDFDCTLTGDASIQKRPMDRLMRPLHKMGAYIDSQNERFAPLNLHGSRLHGIQYEMPVASAQVKSALLLAGLYATGNTTVVEPAPSRNHTEIMLRAFGATMDINDKRITIQPATELCAKKIHVPGDISSAAFFIVAACILPGSHIVLQNIGVNETRTGIIKALIQMGANIRVFTSEEKTDEPVADIEVRSSALHAIRLDGDIIPTMIDELPVFAIAAAFATGTTTIADAAELKVKESNRIHAMVCELSKMGAKVEETDDGMIIYGQEKLHGATVESYHDHRVAMSLAIAALGATGATVIQNASCVDISFPDFYKTLARAAVNK